MTALKPGMAAPPFEGIDQDGNTVRLEDYRGKTLVLYFYPKDMTPGCTAEAISLKEGYDQLRSRGVEVLGVSPDPPERHVKFIQKHDLPFRLIADTDHKIAEAYGVWGKKKFMGREYMGVHRTTFIIDPEGKISHVITKVDTKNHADQVMRLLDEMQ